MGSARRIRPSPRCNLLDGGGAATVTVEARNARRDEVLHRPCQRH